MKAQIDTTMVVLIVFIVVLLFMLLYIGLSTGGSDFLEGLKQVLSGL